MRGSRKHCLRRKDYRPRYDDTIDLEDEHEFDSLLKSVIRRSLLNEPCSKYQDIVKKALNIVDSATNLKPIHQSIEHHLNRIRRKHPEFSPRPLTLGAFFFGAYLNSDQYTTPNRYCDPVAAFSIPRFTDEKQVCDANVAFYPEEDVKIYVNNGKRMAVVHLDNSVQVSPRLLSQLQKDCQEVIVYQNGRKVYETEDQSVETNWEFPHPSTVKPLETNIPQAQVAHPCTHSNFAAPLAVVLALVYVWVSLRALR